MNILQIAEIVIGSIISLGVLVAGAGYLWGQVFVGKNRATREDYNLLILRIEALQRLCDAQQKELTQLHQDFGRVVGQNEEKDKKIKELTDLINNRDPALSEYLKFVRQSIGEFKEDIKKNYEYLELIDSKINKILTGGKIN